MLPDSSIDKEKAVKRPLMLADTGIPMLFKETYTLGAKKSRIRVFIAAIIQYDPAITASGLRTCNATYFGLKHPAESIKDAVNLLGTDQIIDLVLLKSGEKALSGVQEGYDLHQGDMWRYSVSSAIIAKQIAQRLNIDHVNTIFMAALLKDIGKIIQNYHLNDTTLAEDKDIAVVYLADCICMMIGIGVGADGLAYRFHKNAMAVLGIDADDISKIIASFTCQMQAVEDLLHVV